MRRARVSVTLPAEVRDRLANEALTRPESLDAHLGRLITQASGIAEPAVVEELRQARAEAAARSRELGDARRRIRDLQARLNSLQAGSPGLERPPWSLDDASRSPAEREAWWRWLAAGVDRLRQRYRVVDVNFEEHREKQWWWESPARVRALAIAVGWDEALDRGGDSVPCDPRYGEAFLDYLWRLRSRDLTIAPVSYFYGSIEGWQERERAAFEAHICALADPVSSEPATNTLSAMHSSEAD